MAVSTRLSFDASGGTAALRRKRRNLTADKDRLAYFLIGLPLLYVVIVIVLPLLFNIYASLFSWRLVVGDPVYVGFGNYAEVLTEKRWLYSLLRTLAFAGLAVGIELVVGFAIALLLYHRFNNLRWLQALFLTPMMISEVAAALAWRLMLSGEGGLANWITTSLGLPAQLWLGPDWAFLSIVAVDVWQQTPFVVLVMFAALQGVPKELLEAAELDGAPLYHRIAHVIIPIVRPALSIVLIFRTVFALRAFTTVWILTGGGPGDRTAVLGIEIYRTAFSSFETGLGAALSIIMLLMSLIIAVFYMRAFRRESLA
ncbi:MAG TPA: sugar ABC transporter permease [Dongiaceae bacterium]|jgi:multiple sugar transport system permease protein|nr:sugar ABC transporter permease [Dongiaceae bacterium]